MSPPDSLTILPENPAPELAEEIWYDGPGGRRLRLLFAPAPSRFDSTRGTVLVSPGRTEFIEKYFEVVRDLQARGFSVVVFDWPGQGLSHRDLKDPLAGHIDSFDVFVEAFEMGLAAVTPRLSDNLVLLAHSMGGAIGLEAIRRGAIEVRAAAFSSPLWGLKLPPMGAGIVRTMCALGQGRKLTSAHVKEEHFAENEVTGDLVRWQVQRMLMDTKPELALGSVTWQWVRAVLDVFKEFNTPGEIEKIDIPILVASAEAESIVDNDAHHTIVNRLLNAEHIIVREARHEILMETEPRRSAFFEALDRLLRRADI